MTPTATSFDTLLTIEGLEDGKTVSIKRSALIARLVASHLPHSIPSGDLAASLKGAGMDLDMDASNQQLLDEWKAQRPAFIQRMKAGGAPYVPSEDPEMDLIIKAAT
jgi:hypothetical protein